MEFSKFSGNATRAAALVAYATRAAALVAIAIRAAALFASGDLGKSMPGSSKANFGSYGPPI